MIALLLTFPSPLVGEGRVGGREVALSEDGCKQSSVFAHHLPTPTPNPSPQGAGQSHVGIERRQSGGVELWNELAEGMDSVFYAIACVVIAHSHLTTFTVNATDGQNLTRLPTSLRRIAAWRWLRHLERACTSAAATRRRWKAAIAPYRGRPGLDWERGAPSLEECSSI